MQSSLPDKLQNAVSLRLQSVHRAFSGGIVAVDRFGLDITAGQFVAILGPSGCGKSTLLRMIAGLDRPTSGAIHTHHPANHPVKTAYVFQDAHLLPWRTVLNNVALPLELAGLDHSSRLNSAIEAIEQVGLSDAIHRYPSQLSGGMRMRVSLARALVTNPDLLLLDEPFAALDEITRQHLDEQLHQLWQNRGMTVIFVTHSIIEAAFLAQRAIVLTSRPARIVIDHSLALPVIRKASLRTDPNFSAEMRILFEALQRGEEATP